MFKIHHSLISSFSLLICILFLAGVGSAGEVRVAVAANFAGCLEVLAQQFQESSGNTVVPIVGSTGRHFAQISAGAPFDVFLAADEKHPQLLIENGLAEAASCFTYARGRLVLWLADSLGTYHLDIRSVLVDPRVSTIAMANPRLAPYGEAAIQTLENLGLATDSGAGIVMGTSVGQTWQFAVTGNTDAAFVALSQVKNTTSGRYLLVPDELYGPLNQQAVLLSRAASNPTAVLFMKFMASSSAGDVIKSYGYLIRDPED